MSGSVPARRRLLDVAPYLAILAVTLWMFRGVLPSMWSRYVGLTSTHWVEGVTWWYWNITHGLFLGFNPLENNLHGFPFGYDHIRLIGSFGDAALSAPIFWLLEAPASYNVTIIAYTLFNGMAAYLFFSRWIGSRWIGLCCAVAIAFHPLFLFFLEEGRPTQYLFGWSYLALAGAHSWLTDPHRGSTRLMTVSVVGAFVCFWFNGFFFFIQMVCLGVSAALRMRPDERRALARRGLLSAGLAVVCSFPFGLPVLLDVLGEGGIKGVRMFKSPDPAHFAWASARLLEPFLPENRFSMMLPYVLTVACGAALLVGVYLVARRGERPSTPVLGFAAAGVLFYVLILGPYLHIGNQPFRLDDGRFLALPWVWLYKYVPFYSRLSYPYLVFPFLMMSALFLFGAALSRLPGARGRWAANLVAAAMVVEVFARGSTFVVTGPFSIPEYYRELREDSSITAIVEFPFGATDFRQVYQTIHLKPMVGIRGDEAVYQREEPYAGFFRRTPLLAKLYDWQITSAPLSDITASDIRDLANKGVGCLIVSRQAWSRSPRMRMMPYEEMVRDLETVFGQPFREYANLVVFRLEQGTSATGVSTSQEG